MTNRIVCCLAVSFALGLCYGREQSIWLWVCEIGLVLWRTLAVRRKQGQKAALPSVLHLLLSVVFFAAGICSYSRQQQRFEWVRQCAQKQGDIQVQGKIDWKEQKKEQTIYYLKDAEVLTGKYHYPCGKVQVFSSTDSYQIGNCILAEGRYEAFQTPQNEGNFNEEQYYYSKNINLRVRAEYEQCLRRQIQPYRMWLWKLRQRMEQVFECRMSKSSAGVMANMVLGSRNLADEEVRELYQKAGISHVLAVSGLHVSLFGMGIYLLLKRMCCPVWLAALSASGVVYGFGMLTGMELSTARAVMMFVMMMAAGTMGYTYDTLTALGISALFQLWENPFVLWYAGFLLSYTAVFGAVEITRLVRKNNKKRTGRKITDTIRTSLCIQVATLPVLLFFYYEVPVYSVPVNGCILPFMGALLFLGTVGGITGLFCTGLSEIFLKAAGWMLAGCEEICRFFIRLPGSSVITGKPSPEKIIVYYTILFFMLFLVKRTEKKRFLLVWIGLVMMLCSGNQTKGAEVDFLDVGQGDGIFLQTKEGKGVFVDGGSTDVGKVGRYRILPFLKSRGIRKIELWFVSHADEDHISGLKEILEEGYPIECVVFTENVVRDEAIEKLVQLAEEKGSAIYDMKAGEQVKLEEARFTLLYPWKEGNDRNQNSMVLLTEVDGMTGVLPGDIGEGQEKEILAEAKNQKYLQKPLVFYKAAHHGADSSNSLEFLEKLKPIVSVISCGENNSYGHPGKNAVHRIEKVGAKVFYTMRSGQIQIKCDEREIIVKKYKN